MYLDYRDKTILDSFVKKTIEPIILNGLVVWKMKG